MLRHYTYMPQHRHWQSDISPLLFFLVTQGVIFILGLFMEVTTIIFITMPFFMPIADILGIDPVHFGIVSLVSLELTTYRPPFGLVLYAAHSMLSEHVTLNTMLRIAIPFFPHTVLWLPNLMLR